MSEPSATSLYLYRPGKVIDSSAIKRNNNSTSDSSSSPPSDESIISSLIESEANHLPHSDYLRHSVNLTARQDSINWMLKVHAHYGFRPVTALLSVNYFDRFLSTHPLPPEKNGWPFQLLAVACISLAAKMEEPYVPLLLDLQVLEPRFLFEPKTVQRMELWVMANLDWRLRSVTPFDYLHYFVSKLPSSDHDDDPSSTFIVCSASSDLILKTTRVIDFLGFPPSITAAAAVICAAGQSVDMSEMFHYRLNKEMVRSCHQLMEEYLVDTCASHSHKNRLEADAEAAQAAVPTSPIGVLDAAAASAACASCETRSADNPPSSSSSPPAVAGRSSKRPRSSSSQTRIVHE